ncbi:TIGR03943 family putative permease subunit [Anaerosinus massiliensis]|uniref:TIGR03943 family putative permease subunit n=1 Tax=Massilibacillus massiliensis TaxID=1806837 RepID=UPI000DA5FC10|nr:TIGR03943 family protein [Massilibacillus massiliensis]
MSKLNKEAVVRTVILLGFVLLLFWLIMTEQITLYVHPRIINLIKLSNGLFFMMFLLQCWKLKKTWNKSTEQSKCCSRYWRYSPFFFTLAIAILLPNTSLNASLVPNKGLNSQVTNAISKQNDRPIVAEMRNANLIRVSDTNFLDVMSELQRFPQAYVGKEIDMKGFIYIDGSTPQAHFSLIRFVVGCCVADALPAGVLCEMDHADEYHNGDWYQIQGVIENNTRDGKTSPVVKVTWIKAVPNNTTPYVFP